MTTWTTKLFFVLLVVSFCTCQKSQSYSPGEPVALFVNTVGPYANPSETFEFYKLPFCAPEEVRRVRIKQSIGMAIEGGRLYSSAFEHHFAAPITNKELCKRALSVDDVKKFKKAVQKDYYYEMWIDGLAVHDFVGFAEQDEDGNDEFYLYQHIHFSYLFNDNHIIQVNVTSDPKQSVRLRDDDMEVVFSYSSSWSVTDLTLSDRVHMQRPHPKKMEIHWLSILNSAGLVLLLVGFISVVINRIIRKDITRYSASLEDGEDDDEYGWKLIHGDVFRFPSHQNLFSAFLGVGVQLMVVCFLLLILSIIGLLYPEQMGSIYTASFAVFALASSFSGATSAAIYKKLDGTYWARNILLAATLFAFPTSAVSIAADIIARFYHSTSALPVTTAIQIFSIWLFIGLPMTIFGGIAGRRMSSPFSPPVRTKNAIREIPPIPLYRQAIAQFAMGGFIPFSAIYIELFYIYEMMWGHHSYGLYSVLFLVFIILLLVTACISVALTYFQLASEDHRWWWRSFFTGGSTAFFVLLYSIYYFFVLSNMNGFLQIVKYFSFVAISCYFFFVMLGTVGFFSSFLFVKYIYSTLKID